MEKETNSRILSLHIFHIELKKMLNRFVYIQLPMSHNPEKSFLLALQKQLNVGIKLAQIFSWLIFKDNLLF